ncbi:MAG: MarP family serine protease [Acidimicrobiales bacterium]
MDLFDLIVVAVAVAAAFGGYRLGFLGRVASWLGLAAGFYVAIRVLPRIVVGLGSASPSAQLLVVAVILVGGAMVGQGVGLLVGSRLHRALPLGPLRQTDRVVGAVVGIVGVGAALWLMLPSISAVPGWPARATTGSGISRWVSANLPAPPDALQVLRRLVGNDAPQVFAELHQGAPTGPPPAVSGLSQALTNAVTASTVKVEGQACDRIYEGSGFAVSSDLVVTNAHVVAGEPPGDTSVLLPTGQRLPARVVMFDPNRDLALLSVERLGERPLPLKVAHTGATGAVFGHPNGQDAVAVTPARVAQEETAVGKNLYDSHTTRRDVLVLAAALAHGDSGGALVDPAGDVIGVAFAISADQPTTSYALSVTELQGALGEPRTASGTSTGPCLTSG